MIDIVMKHNWYVGQIKKHNLLFGVTIIDPKDILLFIAISNSHL